MSSTVRPRGRATAEGAAARLTPCGRPRRCAWRSAGPGRHPAALPHKELPPTRALRRARVSLCVLVLCAPADTWVSRDVGGNPVRWPSLPAAALLATHSAPCRQPSPTPPASSLAHVGSRPAQPIRALHQSKPLPFPCPTPNRRPQPPIAVPNRCRCPHRSSSRPTRWPATRAPWTCCTAACRCPPSAAGTGWW
jgi:hypothetical protein